MERFLPDERLEPLRELTALLSYNGVKYREEESGVRFAFEEAGCRWEVACRFAPNAVMIYGVYPFLMRDEGEARRAMDRVNATLIRGSLFLMEGRPVLRTSADLIDAYSAYEAILRALEYNAGAMLRFWNDMAGLKAQ